MRSKRFVLGGACAAVVAVILAYVIGRAGAAGIPTMAPVMTYSGTLTDSSGVALAGSKSIELRLWNVASGGTTPLCLVSSSQILSGGSFQIPLPDTCTAAVHANPDVWTEIVVDGVSLGRTKVGAVAFAVEAANATNAGHATAADTATNATSATNATNATNATTATGALDTRIKTLEGATITKLDIQYATAADAFHDQCVANALYCGIVANRKCAALGYRGGWYVGETPDGFATLAVMCVK